MSRFVSVENKISFVPTNTLINEHISFSPAKAGTGCLEFKLPAGS